jgi:hypothetical protein
MDLSTTCIGRQPPGQQLHAGAAGYGLIIHVNRTWSFGPVILCARLVDVVLGVISIN